VLERSGDLVGRGSCSDDDSEEGGCRHGVQMAVLQGERRVRDGGVRRGWKKTQRQRLHGRQLGGGSVGGEYGSCERLTISRGIQVAGPTTISPLFMNAGGESVGESLRPSPAASA
jgi:hypothetical protein